MRRVLSLGRALWHDQSGIAALEFAIIGSALATLVVGTVEVSNAIRVRSKLEVTAGQLAEFVAGQSSVTTSTTASSGTLADMCMGAAMNLAPYPVSTLSANIVSVSVDHPINRVANSTDNATVNAYLDWESISSCATKASSSLALAGAFPLADSPTSLLTKTGSSANDSSSQNLKYGNTAIIVKVQYSYSNLVNFFLSETMSFTAYAVARPRSNATTQCTDSNGKSCPASS